MSSEKKKSVVRCNTTQLARILIDTEIGKKLNMSHADGGKIFQAVASIITERLSEENFVTWHNFGNFKVIYTKARTGVNPRTKEPIEIEAGKRAHFIVAKHVKTSVTTGIVPEIPSRSRGAKSEEPEGDDGDDGDATEAAPAAKPKGKAKGKAKGAAKPAKKAKGGFKPSETTTEI